MTAVRYLRADYPSWRSHYHRLEGGLFGQNHNARTRIRCPAMLHSFSVKCRCRCRTCWTSCCGGWMHHRCYPSTRLQASCICLPRVVLWTCCTRRSTSYWCCYVTASRTWACSGRSESADWVVRCRASSCLWSRWNRVCMPAMNGGRCWTHWCSAGSAEGCIWQHNICYCQWIAICIFCWHPNYAYTGVSVIYGALFKQVSAVQAAKKCIHASTYQITLASTGYSMYFTVCWEMSPHNCHMAQLMPLPLTHPTLARNFTKYWPIFKILSLLDSVGNL